MLIGLRVLLILALSSLETPGLSGTDAAPHIPVRPLEDSGCDVTIRGHHGGQTGAITWDLARSLRRSSIGLLMGSWKTFRDQRNGGELIERVRPAEHFSRVVRLDFGCDTGRQYRFFFRAEVGSQDFEYTHYYPNDVQRTSELVIDLGDVSRFFEAIQSGPPLASGSSAPDSDSGGTASVPDLDGVWVRRESNNDPNDGMRVEVSDGRAVLTSVPATAGRDWQEGEVLWQDIRPDGRLEVLGSDNRYYAARLTAGGRGRIHIDVDHNGAGNDQTWERGERGGDDIVVQQELTGTEDGGFENVEIAEACADQLRLDPTIAAIVDPIVESEITEQELVGLAVGVLRNGEIVHLKGYGYADRENGVPVTTETLFRWASISKTVTAVAAIQMWEDDELDLDADVGDLVPEYDEVPSSVITLRQLLGNTAGVEPYPPGWWAAASTYPSTSVYDPFAALPILNDTLEFTPGTQWRYSTMNFMLAGAAMERIARANYGFPSSDYSSAYEQFVQERIAEPLCMETLTVDYPNETSPLDAKRYGKRPDNVIFRYAGDRDEVVHWRLPGGGFQSRLVDLALFANGLQRQSLLTSEGEDELTAETPLIATREPSYALGLYVRDDFAPARLGHGGTQFGVRNHMYSYPADDLTILFLSNNTHTDRERIQRRLLAALTESTWPVDDYEIDGHIDCGVTAQTTSDDLFAGIWRDGPAPQVLRRGYTRGVFARERERLQRQGYHLTDLETFEDDGERLWDGVFTNGIAQTYLWRGFSAEDFTAKIAEQRSRGYELADVEVFSLRPGVGSWAGVFEPSDEDRTLIQDRDVEEFRDVYRRLTDLGHRLVDIEKYEGPNGERWFAGLFVRGSGGHDMDLDVSPEEVIDRRNRYARAGLRIVEMERYTSGTNPPRWALVAGPIEGNPTARLDKTFCGTWNGPLTGFWETHLEQSRQGRSLIDFERYAAD